jgi:hypothetical protein
MVVLVLLEKKVRKVMALLELLEKKDTTALLGKMEWQAGSV